MKLQRQEPDQLRHLKADIRLVKLAQSKGTEVSPTQDACVWLEKLAAEVKKQHP